MTQTDSSYQSNFRLWFDTYLKTFQDNKIEWPQLLRSIIQQEFDQVLCTGKPYTGPQVFIDRDSKAKDRESHRKSQFEIIQCYKLYRETHCRNNGALTVGDRVVWLISCQVPNQGNKGGRRADLLGLRQDGSLVVFEAKAARKSGSPLHALLEGLDYLSHLLLPDNLQKLNKDFGRWRSKHGQPNVYSQTPRGFEIVCVDPKARHAVIVLAPEKYYEGYSKDSKGLVQGWQYLSDRFWKKSRLTVELDFGITDYSTAACPLLPLESDRTPVISPGG